MHWFCLFVYQFLLLYFWNWFSFKLVGSNFSFWRIFVSFFQFCFFFLLCSVSFFVTTRKWLAYISCPLFTLVSFTSFLHSLLINTQMMILLFSIGDKSFYLVKITIFDTCYIYRIEVCLYPFSDTNTIPIPADTDSVEIKSIACIILCVFIIC